ncbi:MAG: hypothetical protein ACLS3V_04300 [Streptococcus sp.]
MKLPYVVSILLVLLRLRKASFILSRDAMNIAGMGPSVVEKLFKADWLKMWLISMDLNSQDFLNWKVSRKSR